MTISHRLFTPSFLHRPQMHRSSTHEGAKVVGARAEGASTGITCTPWEGLYLEVNEANSVVADSLRPNPDLERFLGSLMYGE
jgi:hypothetical protein